MTRIRPRGVLPAKRAVEYGSVIVLPGGGLSLVVLGKPAPKGSKSAIGQEDNPRTKPWLDAIKKVCADHLPAGWAPLDGPLDVELWCYFKPPASAARGSLPCTKTTYDVDKLERAVFDGLTQGGAIVDDARIVDATVRKRYLWDEGEERAVVVVTSHGSP